MIQKIVQPQAGSLRIVHTQPAVSITLPFEPKMYPKREIRDRLDSAVQQVKKELKESYPDSISNQLLSKLNAVIDQLEFNTFKKSLAIFVSLYEEKVYYLNFSLQQAVMVSPAINIRNIIQNKVEQQQFLLLEVANKGARIFLGNSKKLLRLITNTPEQMPEFGNDLPQKVSNFSDTNERRQIMLKKFLRYVDDGLSVVLKAYSLPLVIMATDKTYGYFKQISKNKEHIVELVHGSYNHATEAELQMALRPLIRNWQQTKVKSLLMQIEKAKDRHQLSIGIHEVLKAARQKKGRLLIVEKNYRCIKASNLTVNKPFSKRDLVELAIEDVLKDGGEVELVNEGVLKNDNQIVLIHYY